MLFSNCRENTACKHHEAERRISLQGMIRTVDIKWHKLNITLTYLTPGSIFTYVFGSGTSVLFREMPASAIQVITWRSCKHTSHAVVHICGCIPACIRTKPESLLVKMEVMICVLYVIERFIILASNPSLCTSRLLSSILYNPHNRATQMKQLYGQ